MNIENEKQERTIRAIVVSAQMEKSGVARVGRLVRHGRIGKYIRRTTKFVSHDELNQASVGDEVLLKQTRPKSKRKSFELVKIIDDRK